MPKTADNISTDYDPSEWETKVEPFAPSFQWDESKEESRVLIGTYVSHKVVPFEDSRSGEPRDSKVYTIERLSDGEKFSVWGSFNIDLAFTDIAPGKVVRIEYQGQVDTKDGNRVNQFAVAVKK